MVDLIVMKAESQDGEKLFTAADDRIELMGEETTVISEIANYMFGTIDSCGGHSKKLKTDQSRLNLIALADRLHKTIEEIEQISVNEYHEWLAYFHIISEQADGNSRR